MDPLHQCTFATSEPHATQTLGKQHVSGHGELRMSVSPKRIAVLEHLDCTWSSAAWGTRGAVGSTSCLTGFRRAAGCCRRTHNSLRGSHSAG